MRRCGADRVIDYTTADFAAALAPAKCDAALDCTGETARCKAAVKPGGVVVSILGIPDATTLRAVIAAYHMDPPPCMGCVGCVLASLACCRGACSAVRVRNIITLPSGRQLEALARTCLREGIVPTVDRVFTLEEAPAAFDYVECGHVTGKVLVEIFVGAAAPSAAKA